MDKIKLETLIDNYRQNKNGRLYDKFIHNNIPIEKYNKEQYDGLILNNMYLYYKLHGLDKLNELGNLNLRIPERIPSLLEFINILKRYKNVSPTDKYHNNFYEQVLEVYGQKLLSIRNYEWVKMYSEKMTGEKTPKIGKIYLAVNNKDLHKFATLLFHECIRLDISDYQFKIADDDDLTRKDNVVIYFTEENFPLYISAIEKIIEENPLIELDESNYFAHEYDEHIMVAKDFGDESSFTDTLCSLIDMALDENKLTTEQIVDKLEIFINNQLQDVIDLCEKTKQQSSYKR